MQWDGSLNAGFTPLGATPWLPLAADAHERNVAAQNDDPASMLNFYRALTTLRRAEPALNRGAYEGVDLGVADVLAYRRVEPGYDGFLVILNLGAVARSLNLRTAVGAGTIAIALSTDPARGGSVSSEGFVLTEHEGVIFRLSSADRVD